MWAVSLLTKEIIPHGLTPGVQTLVFGVWLGRVGGKPPKPIQYLYPQRPIYPRLVQKLFRGEPDIYEFD
jgi:hypothetical protein